VLPGESTGATGLFYFGVKEFFFRLNSAVIEG